MERVVSSTELQKKTREIIDWARVNREPVVIQTHGKPMAAILSYKDYQKWLQFVAVEKEMSITAVEQAELKQMGELLSVLADVTVEEIEAGREDRWF
jgi:prevent-host-death family protein